MFKLFFLPCLILSPCGEILFGLEKTPSPPVVQSIDEVEPAFGQCDVAVVFCSDDNYAMYLGVCLQSLIDNSSPDPNYDIRILDGGIVEKKTEKSS